MTELKPGIYYDVPSEVYHSDPCERPSLSASIAHTLVSRSARHAWRQHPRLGGKPKRRTREMDQGTICHAIKLGIGKEFEVLPDDPETGKPYFEFRKNAAKAYRDEIEGRGKIALLQKQVDEARELIDAVDPELRALGIEFTGRSEVMVVWDETTERGELVRCRSSLDHLILSDGIIYDLKFVHSAHVKACQSHVYGFGGDIQATAYERGVVANHPELAGRIRFTFVFVETDTAIVTPITLAGSMRYVGESRWRRAVNRWADCCATGKWPPYVTAPHAVEAPTWAITAEEDAKLSENWPSFAAPDGPSNAHSPEPGAMTDDKQWDGDDRHLF